MRIDRLTLARFGMFTNVTLDLLPTGVNVIVGANEAGKTTAMAAIRQLLYGIPVRSEHGFVHPMQDLRVDAVLSNKTGTQLAIARIKRRADTLRSPVGERLDESLLRAMLSDIDERVYQALFSIGHEEVTTGGESLLENDGELGQALFGAGTGLTRLNKAMAQLKSKADGLFKESGSVPLINSGIRRYKDLSKEVRDLSKDTAKVVKLDDDLRQAEAALELVGARSRALSEKKNLAERVRATRPLVQARRQAKATLITLEGQGPRVTPDVPDRLAAAQQRRRDARSKLAVASGDLERLNEQISQLNVDEPLVAQADLIGDLVTEIGALRQNVKDLPSLNKQVGDLERQLEALQRSLPEGCPVGANGLPAISVATRAAIDRLVQAYASLASASKSARSLLDDVSGRLGRARDHLRDSTTPLDIAQLRSAVGRVREEGRLEAARNATLRKLVELETNLSATVTAIGVTAAPRSVDGLPLPAPSRVAEADTRVTASTTDVNRRETEIQFLQAQQESKRATLDELLRREAPPSEAELTEARERRDEGWRLVRAAWLDGGADAGVLAQWTEGAPLDTTYEVSVRRADGISDRLHRDASAVERRRSLERDLQEIEGALATQAEEIKGARAKAEAAWQEWTEIWVPLGVEPGARHEMDDLLDRLRQAAADAATLRGLDAEASAQQTAIGSYRRDLSLLLVGLGVEIGDDLSLAALLDLAEIACARSDQARETRAGLQKSVDDLTKDVRGLEAKVAAAEGEMAVWMTQWAASVAVLGLTQGAAPSDVMAVMSTISKIEAVSESLGDKQRRVDGIERRNTSIEKRIVSVVEALSGHADIDVSQPEVAIGILNARLSATQHDATMYRSLLTQRDEKSVDVDTARTQVAASDTDITEMISAAELGEEQALVDAVARTEQYSACTAHIVQAEKQLIATTGLSLDRLEREVDDFERVDLETEIGELGHQCDRLDQHREEQALFVGELRKERAGIDASGRAAVCAERAQETLADVVAHADEYVRTVLARVLLKEQVADYRERNQGPILTRASQLFHDLTLGRYTGLDTDMNEKGVPLILAQTSGYESLDVAKLSIGTRDQLYLALRLAALEHFVQRRGSLPLTLDDLFVHFDDDRTEAGLRVLQCLSAHVQVLLFTHHESVAAQAQAVLPPPCVRILRLATPANKQLGLRI